MCLLHAHCAECVRDSPHAALASRIHLDPDGTLISFGKVLGVGERTDNSNDAWRVNGASDLGECVFRSH